MAKTTDDEMDLIDDLMGQTVYKFLSKISDDELERLHHTLQMHMSSPDGKNDKNVEVLFEVVEFELIHRD